VSLDLLYPIAFEWGATLLRWLHVITGMAWIGASFYFMHLDASLRAVPDIKKGGEAWEVHGGGFYQVRKYLVAPDTLPSDLIWHKWQSYSTWISGFFLLVWVYYAQSELYLIDPTVRELSTFSAAAIGIIGLLAGWVFYDLLARAFGKQEKLFAALGLGLIMVGCFTFQQFFSGRGALIHTGAMMATWMTANVFFIIIPNQRKVIASLMMGEAPDPALGLQAKERSTHNNYITLPVVFLMLSSHNPLTSSTPYAWLLVGCVTVAGALVRVFYNLRHGGKGNAWWTWIMAAVLLLAAMFISLTSSVSGRHALGLAAMPIAAETNVAAVPEHVTNIVQSRCSMCHARDPLWPGMAIAPKGIYLETTDDIARNRLAIMMQAALSKAMPPNNVTVLEEVERQELLAWASNNGSLQP
jgi:uncharacterized membrane protein